MSEPFFSASDIIALVSICVALVSVIVSPRVALKIAKQQTVGPMRLNKIENIREHLSMIISTLTTVCTIQSRGREYSSGEKEKIVKEIFFNVFNIQLLLFGDNPNNKKLLDVLFKSPELLHIKNAEESDNELVKFADELMRLAHLIIDDQWDQIIEGK